MLLRAGVNVHRNGRHVTVVNADELVLDRVSVPGDVSSAAFMIAAGVLVPGSRLLIAEVGVNWTRTGFLRILRRMRGIVLGDLEEETGEIAPAEPTSDLDVAHGALEATVVEPDEVPGTIDELPLVALVGCFAEGETVVRGAQELRIKESDRITAVVEGLRGLGADIEATDDGFAVRGTGGLRGGMLDARGDHRMAMLGAVAGLASREGVEVVGIDAAAVSYPGFVEDLMALHECSTSRRTLRPDGGSDRRARRRRQVHRRSRSRCAPGLRLSRQRRPVPLCRAALAGVPRGRARAARARRRDRAVPRGAAAAPGTVLLGARDVSEAIRTPAVSERASHVAADPDVRAALVLRQRQLLAHGDWVAEGRDIGTVVAPEAELKVFLTAKPEERARRRAVQSGADRRTVLAEQALRDERDRTREHSPLRPAPGAVELDTTGLSVEQVVERIAALARAAAG